MITLAQTHELVSFSENLQLFEASLLKFEDDKTRFQQMADGLVSQLQSANKVSEEINLLTKQSAYLSEKDMENLKEVYKVELETPIQILHEIGMIEKDEDYLSKERW